MIVLHAALCDRAFLLWGEAAAVNARAPTRVPPILPFGAAKDTLVAALAAVLPGVRVHSRSASMRTLWLPSAGGQPLASTPLIAPRPEARQSAALQPWSVSVLAVAVPTLVELLAATIDKRTIAPGLTVGADWAFWGAALRFAAALVTRQQMLPALTQSEGGWRACWEAVFSGADAERLEKLAQAMPHACRALSDGATRPPSTSAVAVLSAAVHEFVDNLT